MSEFFIGTALDRGMRSVHATTCDLAIVAAFDFQSDQHSTQHLSKAHSFNSEADEAAYANDAK
jgi:hypothetical protein